MPVERKQRPERQIAHFLSVIFAVARPLEKLRRSGTQSFVFAELALGICRLSGFLMRFGRRLREHEEGGLCGGAGVSWDIGQVWCGKGLLGRLWIGAGGGEVC